MTLEWMSRAACKGQPDAVFFPDDKDDGEQPDYTTARHICAGCPVRVQCLAYALELNIGHGMFAGLTPTERANVRRQRRGKAA
jgi:WhiB family transcriptional regulator, redox-sensing transcriptional regulator